MEINLEKLTEQCGNKECPVIEVLKTALLQIAKLEARVKELEEKLNTNSSNSSKPPSTDGLKRNTTVSLREKSGKKSGGQAGHQGNTLKMVEIPDKIIPLNVSRCYCCGENLYDTVEHSTEKRQVFDIPKITIEVTEYRAFSKVCSKCNSVTKATFPAGVNNKTQYGENIKSQITYFNQYQLIPLDRTTEIFEDLYDVSISEGTIVNITDSLSEKLEPFETATKEILTQSTLIHKDETGIFVENKLHWLHSTSTEKYTHYFIHPKRGTEAMNSDNILPLFKGILVHDFWKPYFTYNGMCHALCNSHHLRELKSVFENTQQEWPVLLASLLKLINREVYKAKNMGQVSFSPETLALYNRQYDELISEGFRLNPAAEKETIKQGKTKQSKPYNLLKRLSEKKNETLRFMNNFDVPFTNNLAERDIRMTKLKQKISGTFRSMQGAKTFCRIRAYISTLRKNGASVIDEIKNAFREQYFMPNTQS